MSREPDARSPTVTYANAEPSRINITVARWEGDMRYADEYTFRMDGSTAVLKSIKPDADYYHVQDSHAQRTAAAEAVEALPFVQAVSLFPEVDE